MKKSNVNVFALSVLIAIPLGIGLLYSNGGSLTGDVLSPTTAGLLPTKDVAIETFTATPAFTTRNSPIVFSLRIRNNGKWDEPNNSVVIPLPKGVEYVITNSDCSAADLLPNFGPVVTCDKPLGVGARVTLTFSAKVDVCPAGSSSQSVKLAATISSLDGDQVLSNNTALLSKAVKIQCPDPYIPTPAIPPTGPGPGPTVSPISPPPPPPGPGPGPGPTVIVPPGTTGPGPVDAPPPVPIGPG